MTFDLQRIVDKALDTSSEPHPHQVARNVLMRIAPADREEALLVALATYTEARIYERQGEPIPTATLARADSLRTPGDG